MVDRSRPLVLLTFLLALFVAPLAGAAVVASGSANFTEPNGFYTGVKTYTIYTHDDASNPAPGAPGELTYVYTITNDPGSFLAIIGFNLDSPIGSVVSAGFIDDANPATPSPSAVIDLNNGVVRWDWASPDVINPGQVSDQLYIVSAYSPGSSLDTIYSIEGDASFDVTSTCVGPVTPPQMTGDALPCTIGFWKNRADGKQGTLQWFPDVPDAQFDAVVTAAVALAGGLFADEADLLDNLQSKGKRTIEERGKQQLAATFLNLAAGDLFPDNTKCKLFEGNGITTNACGDAISIGDAVTQALADIGGDTAAQHAAQECSDDINNGIGVVN
jgi:hypothetical protein